MLTIDTQFSCNETSNKEKETICDLLDGAASSFYFSK